MRVNIMTVGRRFKFLGAQQLEICYAFGDFHESEFETTYEVGRGNCGIAYEQNRIRCFDRTESINHLDLFRLTPTQEKVTEGINSILSIPVYNPDDDEKRIPVGILNIDSPFDLEQTGFDQTQIQNALIRLSVAAGIVYT